jgi:hypothetical protein
MSARAASAGTSPVNEMLRNMLSYYFLPYLKRTPQMGILFQSLAPDQQKNSWLPGNRHAAVLNRKKNRRSYGTISSGWLAAGQAVQAA